MNAWNKYEPTAARRHGKPGRDIRPKSVTIDIHAHVAVAAAGAYVAQHANIAGTGLDKFMSPEVAAVDAKQNEDMKHRLFEFEPRLKNLDAMGIEAAILELLHAEPGDFFAHGLDEIGITLKQLPAIEAFEAATGR